MAHRLTQIRNLDCQQENRPKSDAVASALKNFIAKGHYAPGERLPSERDLAGALSVSRVSVRSALQHLKAQKIVISRPGGGTYVSTPVSESENPLFELVSECNENLQDLISIHTHLDAWGVRRAAERITDEQVSRLRELVREFKSICGEPKRLSKMDAQLHLEIAQITGSAIFINLSLLARDVLGRMLIQHRVQIFEDMVHVAQIGRRNWLLVEALADRNSDKAEEIMRDRRAYFVQALDLGLALVDEPNIHSSSARTNLYN